MGDEEEDKKSLTEVKSIETEKLTLGGGIELVGFKVVDLPSMVIVKKMVGSYVRTFSEEHKDFEKLVVTTTNKGKKMVAELTSGGKTKKAEVKADNVFVALDKVLKEFSTL